MTVLRTPICPSGSERTRQSLPLVSPDFGPPCTEAPNVTYSFPEWAPGWFPPSLHPGRKMTRLTPAVAPVPPLLKVGPVRGYPISRHGSWHQELTHLLRWMVGKLDLLKALNINVSTGNRWSTQKFHIGSDALASAIEMVAMVLVPPPVPCPVLGACSWTGVYSFVKYRIQLLSLIQENHSWATTVAQCRSAPASMLR